ncbi:MAG: hypothetical protein NZ872_00835 [Archaeoglobaceae archaeon]|nr:hypothetical protein [Archaeoglobaceae archaeon]MDW8127744.1 hypothetical protein [Archaeoglobaceae archaeon]
MKRSLIAIYIVLGLGILLLGCVAQPSPEGTPVGTTPPSQTPKNEEKTDCPIGTFVRTEEGEFRVTGIEKHTVAGRSMDLCCMEVTSEGKRVKFCHDMVAVELGMGGYRNSIYWDTDEDTGNFYKVAEGFEKNGKYCVQYFDVSGSTKGIMCMYKQGDKTCTVFYDEKGVVQMESCG